MRILSVSALLAVLVLLSACNADLAGGSFSFGNTCESRGYTPGTNAYKRCIRDSSGRDVISSGQRRSNVPSGR